MYLDFRSERTKVHTYSIDDFLIASSVAIAVLQVALLVLVAIISIYNDNIMQ